MTWRLVIAVVALATTWPAAAEDAAFLDVTATHLPAKDPRLFSMGAVAADLDGDGDLDLAVAHEFAANGILVNDGAGCFTDGSDALAPITGDHEDVAAADYDRDGDLDLVFVGEDDQVQGYHLNDGSGRFADVTARLRRRSTSNAVAAADFDADGDIDLYVGNNGQDFLFLNDGHGAFSDGTDGRIPTSTDITQHAAVGDLDVDGDLDVVLGNEDGDKLLRNNGGGRFTSEALPRAKGPEETRDIDLGDVEGDGDLDLFLSNVRLFTHGADPQDRLLLNTGDGTFSDATADRLPSDTLSTMSAAFVDFDDDGDLDLVRGFIGDITGTDASMPADALENDGTGHFTPVAALPSTATGNVFDVVDADFDGDGRVDLYLASRGGLDRLLLRPSPTGSCNR